MSEEFDFEAKYRHSDYPGVAWYAHKYSKDFYWEPIYDDEGELIHEDYVDCEDRTRVVCCMVGDDRDFTFDVEELIKLEEGDYCPECGQIGCKAYEV